MCILQHCICKLFLLTCLHTLRWAGPYLLLLLLLQDPWIQNATVHNNLLMGLPFDQDQYNSCVDACCLEKDLQVTAWNTKYPFQSLS